MKLLGISSRNTYYKKKASKPLIFQFLSIFSVQELDYFLANPESSKKIKQTFLNYQYYGSLRKWNDWFEDIDDIGVIQSFIQILENSRNAKEFMEKLNLQMPNIYLQISNRVWVDSLMGHYEEDYFDVDTLFKFKSKILSSLKERGRYLHRANGLSNDIIKELQKYISQIILCFNLESLGSLEKAEKYFYELIKNLLYHNFDIAIRYLNTDDIPSKTHLLRLSRHMFELQKFYNELKIYGIHQPWQNIVSSKLRSAIKSELSKRVSLSNQANDTDEPF
jgi:hypothetical protein